MNQLKPEDKDRKKKIFLDLLSKGCSVTKAAAGADLAQATPYRWRMDDPEFTRAWQEAVDAGTDLLEDEAYRRAVEGDEEPQFYNGEVVGVIRRKSDTLLMFMLKARRPFKFRERAAIEHSLGEPLKSENDNVSEIVMMIEELVRGRAAPPPDRPDGPPRKLGGDRDGAPPTATLDAPASTSFVPSPSE